MIIWTCFCKPTPERYEIVCWIWNYEGHRAVHYPKNWGLPPNFDEVKCTRCSQNGHQTNLCGIKKKRYPSSTRHHIHTRKTASGKRQWAGPAQKLRGRVALVKIREMGCWACDQVGYFAANCPRRRCWFCVEKLSL